MTSRWRQREIERPSTWRQSLLFNSLILLIPIFAARILIAAYTSDIATDPLSLEARTETRQQIESEFRKLPAPLGEERRLWAARIDQTLQERDFSAARGYLLAAPLMLNKQDAAAVLAAADAESSGSRDQRLARAALLFLPEELRASYQRSIAPPKMPDGTETSPESTEEVEDSTPEAENDAPEGAASTTRNSAQLAPLNEPFAGQRSFFLLGDPADLTRRSQRWLAEEQVDSLQLRLRALGLLTQDDPDAEAQAMFEAASIMRAAHRAGRLSDRFASYLKSRVEDALPEEILRAELNIAFETVMTTEARTVEVLDAYRRALQPEAQDRLVRDMVIIARIAELTSSSGAITLVEQATTPEDMRRALLLSESGGHRSVALAREMGPEVLSLAQIGVKWSRILVFQVMGLMALGMALIWTTLSALTQVEAIRLR
ncbi:MAG: hypothetical protein K0U61_10395 [Alphaproteobacteria bacterium]|nr:hypothetical protein [Alphaproteobacteria bacterium]